MPVCFLRFEICSLRVLFFPLKFVFVVTALVLFIVLRNAA